MATTVAVGAVAVPPMITVRTSPAAKVNAGTLRRGVPVADPPAVWMRIVVEPAGRLLMNAERLVVVFSPAALTVGVPVAGGLA